MAQKGSGRPVRATFMDALASHGTPLQGQTLYRRSGFPGTLIGARIPCPDTHFPYERSGIIPQDVTLSVQVQRMRARSGLIIRTEYITTK